MEVSMDGLRTVAVRAYNKLVVAIRENIKKNEGAIEEEDVEEALDDLRMTLGTLAYSYQEGEDGWKSLDHLKLESLNEEEN